MNSKAFMLAVAFGWAAFGVIAMFKWPNADKSLIVLLVNLWLIAAQFK